MPDQPLFSLGHAELANSDREVMASRATRSPIAASVSAARRMRASSAALRKKGRRNGQWIRSPNVSFRARIDAANAGSTRGQIFAARKLGVPRRQVHRSGQVPAIRSSVRS